MFDDGARVEYTPKGNLSYTWAKGMNGTVQYTDDNGWTHVLFDYRAYLGALPCNLDELREVK